MGNDYSKLIDEQLETIVLDAQVGADAHEEGKVHARKTARFDGYKESKVSRSADFPDKSPRGCHRNNREEISPTATDDQSPGVTR